MKDSKNLGLDKRLRSVLNKIPFIKRGEKLTLKSKLLISIILCSVVPSILIAVFVYSVSKDSIEKKVIDMTDEMGTLLTQNLEKTITDIEGITLIPYSNIELIKDFAQDDNQSKDEILKVQSEAKDYFSSIIYRNENISHMYFLKDNGIVFGNTGTSSDVEILMKEIKSTVKATKGEVMWLTGISEDFENIYVVKSMNNEFGKHMGFLVLRVKQEIFNGLFNAGHSSSNRSMDIINNTNTVIASNSKDKVGTQRSNIVDSNFSSGDSLAYENKMENGWELIISTQNSYLMKEINGVIGYIWLIVGLFVILSTTIGILITISVTKPINKIVKLMRYAEKGDLVVEADVNNTEIGKLGNSFNKMILNMKEIIKENKVISIYAVESAEHLKRISKESIYTSEHIATAIEEVSTGATDQFSMVEKVNNDINDLSIEILDVTNNIKNVSSSTGQMNMLSMESINNMEELISKNMEMGSNFNLLNNTIKKLNTDMKEIKEIIAIISKISEQTNLLSLNASIEAARAGEAGRGFAVVADEVRNLSLHTKESTSKIDKSLKKIYTQATRCADIVELSNEIFSDQTEKINNTKDSFNKIIKGTNTISADITLVEDSIYTINDKKEEILETMLNMVRIAKLVSDRTEEVTATTEEQAAAAEELDSLAEKLASTIVDLEQLIGKFKVK
ncbi:methyl-accepting chemotaxis protein [Metabacillus litoralis]|uniref:methyl-accepting chemotaxis protein n=1 Tax=Metabacillus litoralis TaxID=152268 RepID=UPI001CFE1EC2|nr:methyl-accepting chemotaxis protein [Metabacillus litoralis]